jgi:DNA-binding transcriptional MocR family regulator
LVEESVCLGRPLDSIRYRRRNHKGDPQRSEGRQQLASRFLKNVSFAARPSSHHLWLPLPTRQSGTDLLSHLMRRGLAVVGEDAFAVGDNAPRGIRVSLGAARNRSELSQALQVLSGAMKTSAILQIV